MSNSTKELLSCWKNVGERNAMEDWWDHPSLYLAKNMKERNTKIRMNCLSLFYFWCKQNIWGKVGDLIDLIGNE